MQTPRRAQSPHALSRAGRALVLLMALVLLAGCGTGQAPGASATQDGSVASAGGSVFTAAKGEADLPSSAVVASDESAFVPDAGEEEPYLRSPSGNLKVIISLKSQVSKSDTALIASKGGVVTKQFSIVNAVAAEVPDSALDALKADPRVERVELDHPVRAQGLLELNTAWGVARVGSAFAHAAGNTGAGIKVAIVDSGIDYTHPELKASYAGGYDFFERDSNPMDEHGHGTLVAGVVAARDDGMGVVGVAPGVRLYSVRVLGKYGAGVMSDLIGAMQWCVTNRIQVANVSLGSSSYPGAAVEQAFAAAEKAGVVIVCAAGNSGSLGVVYPARFSSCIAVGATALDSTSQRDIYAIYSSRGPSVAIAAPGTALSSAAGGGYGVATGTSLASPHVAGAVALALKSGVAPSDVRQRLQDSALDLGPAGRDDQFGAGLLRVPPLLGLGETPPVVTIVSPMPYGTYARKAKVRFCASVCDFQDSNIPPVVEWTVNGVVYKNKGPVFEAVLADGSYTVTASATDSAGLTGTSVPAGFSVGNARPVVKITAPVPKHPNNAYHGVNAEYGEPVIFSGTATDTENGNVSASLVWKDGGTVIGQGATFTTSTLSPGTHLIRAVATDGGGLSAVSEQVKVNVGQIPLSVALVVGDGSVTSATNGQTVTFTATVTCLGAPAKGATVFFSSTIPNNPYNGYVWSAQADANGVACKAITFDTKRNGAGTYKISAQGRKAGFKDGNTSVDVVVQ